MSIRFLRLLAVWTLAFWLGGFTFYSAVVIPVLHDQLGSPLATGLVTRRVTDALNILGVVTIILGWLMAGFTRTTEPSRPRHRDWATLALAMTTVCLVILICLHRVLDLRLDAARMHDFYPLHRLYLWVSTVQWVANLCLLSGWVGVGPGGFPKTRGENSQVFQGSRMPEIPA